MYIVSQPLFTLAAGQDQLSLPELAGMCRAAFSPDLAVMFEQGAQQALGVIEQWLLSKGCI